MVVGCEICVGTERPAYQWTKRAALAEDDVTPQEWKEFWHTQAKNYEEEVG